MQVEAIVSAAEYFLCDSTCEDCDDATCFVAVSECLGSGKAFLTRRPV